MKKTIKLGGDHLLGFYNYTVILTYLGLFSGVSGIFFAFNGQAGVAVISLLLAGFLDMFDGKVAATRKRTDAEKKFGIQLDSLSDLICFGMLPAAIGYGVGLTDWWYIPVACLYVLAALIRLAYFNVMEEERQAATSERRKGYNGMPVTLVAGWLPLLYCFRSLIGDAFPFVYLGLLVLCGLLFLLAKLKIKKIGTNGMLVVTGIGALLFAAILWLLLK